MKSRFFSQKDPRWANLPRYHAKSSDALQELDEHVFSEVLVKAGKVDYPLIWEAYGRFTAGLVELLDEGMGEANEEGYTLYDYGCWDCVICMIVDQLDEHFYEYGSYTRLDPVPPNFIHSLRSWQVLSVMGFSYDIVIDPVSLVTHSRVQMVLHEDYGVDGVPVKEASVLMHALDCKQQVGIAVSVLGHSSLGSKKDTHWVVVNRADAREGLLMLDPSLVAPARFNYRKIYEVCVYTKYEDVAGVVGVKQEAGLYVTYSLSVTSKMAGKNEFFFVTEVCNAHTR